MRDKPPAISPEKLKAMIAEAIERNTAEWLSPVIDFHGAGEQIISDDHLFDDDVPSSSSSGSGKADKPE